MAIKVGIGLGLERDPIAAVQSASRQAKARISSDKINLAVVFSTAEFANTAVLKSLRSSLGDIPLVGASTLGIISGQGIFRHGLILMLLSLPEGTYCNTAFVKGISAKTPTRAGEELGEKLLYGFKNIPRDLGVLFSDGLMGDGSAFLYGLLEKVGASSPLAGACASDNLEFKKTSVYFNDEAQSDAACGILWGGRLSFGLGVKHGWKALGRPRTVTRSAGHIVYEIDGAPAAAIYKDYLDYDTATLKKELRRISILYPIGVYLTGEEECLLRNIISVGEDESLTCQGNVPQGNLIRLMIGTKESCLDATSQALDEVKAGLLGRPPSFVFVFDSVSRYMVLGRQAEKEVELIKEKLGQDIPILGMYSYGEQAPLKSIKYQGRVYFHNQTISILGIGG